jgi:hypothetical protein
VLPAVALAAAVVSMSPPGVVHAFVPSYVFHVRPVVESRVSLLMSIVRLEPAP